MTVFGVPTQAVAQPIEVKEAWLKRNCLDKGTGDRPTSPREFEACVRRLIEPLPLLDSSRRELFGEKYDPAKYLACRTQPGNRNNSSCNVYVLRRREWPEYWPEGAKRIKWPDPPRESVYRQGMTPKAYWEALCKAEAGEFIYRKVSDAEGFVLLRPRAAETDHAFKDRYVLEDAYGALEFYSSVSDKRPGVHFISRSKETFQYVEAALIDSIGGIRRVRHEVERAKLTNLLENRPNESWGEQDFTRILETPIFKSRYGLTWRGVRRERDIELGVSGGELAVADLSTGETIALRRGFALDPFESRGANDQRWWLASSGCPHMRRDFTTLRAFVRKALPSQKHVH